MHNNLEIRPSHAVRFSATPSVRTFDPKKVLGRGSLAHVAAADYRPIPKPPGQVTRLRRGGYTLIEALGWDEEYYKNVQV